MADDTRIHVLDDAHHIVHLRIGKGILHDFLYLTRLDSSVVDGISSSLAIGYDESAGAKVDTTILTYHDDEDVRQFVAVNLSEDGLACCARWLSIVVGTEL